jgi:hypothetical protein
MQQERDPFINTAIDRGDEREEESHNCFNSFSARADPVSVTSTASEEKLLKQFPIIRALSCTAINRGVNESLLFIHLNAALTSQRTRRNYSSHPHAIASPGDARFHRARLQA